MAEAPKEIAARVFLEKGKIDGISDQELADLCDHMVQAAARSSFVRAAVMARRFAAAAQSHGTVLRMTAAKALARVTHLSGHHAEALKAYREARRLARGQPLVRALIDRALVDVYMYLGKTGEGRRAARRAMAVFSRLSADDDLAKTRVNYANLLHRQDRHREAEILYREAAEYFEKTGDETAAARCYSNRANTLVQLFELAPARKLYEEANRIYDKAGFTLDACDARYGLAWLRMLTGEFHIALLDLSECEQVYRQSGDRQGVALCMLDRAEIYLGLGLYHDAFQAARESEEGFRRLRLQYEAAKAALFLGQAAVALNRKRIARAAMGRARKGFVAERNYGFQGVVHLLAADLADADRARRLQELRLARQRFTRAQLPLWEAVSDLYDATCPERTRVALDRLARNAAASHVPQLYALRKTIEGDYEAGRGNLARARRNWEKAADRLDAIRAQLPPMELRSRFGNRQDSPHVRLIDAEVKRDVMTAAVWSERFKTAGVWAPISFEESTSRARQAVGESLDALARQVAAITRRLGMSYGQRGTLATEARRKLSRLQRQIREKIIAAERGNDNRSTSAGQMTEAFRREAGIHPIIQFHIGREDIIAFIHRADGTILYRFKNGRDRLAGFMRRWGFILESEALAAHLGKPTWQDAERLLWDELGEWLWRPLEIDTTARRILVLPEGELANIPWPALTVDGNPLVERHQFLVAPSLRHYRAARSILADSATMMVFRGGADNIPEVNREIATIREMTGKTTVVFSPCRRQDWPAAGDVNIWHYTGHAELYAVNPFYSFLLLEDGPLFAADFRLKRCRVNLVTLAGCRSGEQVALPGEESTGLVRSLLEMGAGTVIAGLWPVSDTSSRLWMEAFYGRLFDGEGVLKAATHASRTVKRQLSSAYHWAAFTVFGAGDTGAVYGTEKTH